MPAPDEPDARVETPLAEDGLPKLSAVIAEHGLAPKKALGQNFILDLNLTRRIARAAAPLGVVLEVGPGPGGLTRALLMEGAREVVAIERDARCVAALAAVAARWPGRLRVMEADALALDPAEALGAIDGPAQIVANLPYNVGTELVVRWLRAVAAPGGAWWSTMAVMLQREVAERIVAGPGSKAYGRLSVLRAWSATARIAFDVSPRSFTPPPKVTSAVLVAKPAAAPLLDCRLESLERLTAAAFQQRRKMLRSSLRSVSREPEALLAAAGVDPTSRADAIEPEAYAALARALDDQNG